jgi:hypothetical protein
VHDPEEGRSIPLGVAVNRIGAFFAIALVVSILADRPATAASIQYDPNPTAGFTTSMTVPPGVYQFGVFHFTLARPADAQVFYGDTDLNNSSSAPPFTFGYKVLLGDVGSPEIYTNPGLTSLNNLSKDTEYTFVWFLQNTTTRFTWKLGYAVQFTAAVATTPIPPAFPLFAAALTGLGFCGWRKRKTAARVS